MNIRKFTKFAFIVVIAALIAGISACDQIQQLLLPAQDEYHLRWKGLLGRFPSVSSYRRRDI